MATKKISELNAIAAPLDAADVFPVDDISATETKKATLAVLHDTSIAPQASGGTWSVQPLARTGGTGRVIVVAGGGTTDGNSGGTVTVKGGDSSSGAGGQARLWGGDSASGASGSVDVDAGTGASAGAVAIGGARASSVAIGRAAMSSLNLQAATITVLGAGASSLKTTTGDLTLEGVAGTVKLAAYGVLVATAQAPSGADPQLLVAGGSAAKPAVSFAADPNTGLYSIADDQLGVSVGGAVRLELRATHLEASVPVRIAAGSAAAPSLALAAEAGTGLYGAAGTLNVAIAGSQRWAFAGAYLHAEGGSGLRQNVVGSALELAGRLTTHTGDNVVVTNNGSLTGSSGVQRVATVRGTIAQSGTAGYSLLELDATESSTGSGLKKLLDFRLGGSSLGSYVDAAGRVAIVDGGSWSSGGTATPGVYFGSDTDTGLGLSPAFSGVGQTSIAFVYGGGFCAALARINNVGRVILDGSFADDRPPLVGSGVTSTGAIGLGVSNLAVEILKASGKVVQIGDPANNSTFGMRFGHATAFIDTAVAGGSIALRGNKTTEAGAGLIVGNRNSYTHTAGSSIQGILRVEGTINQTSGSGGYTALEIAVSETALGSGPKNMIRALGGSAGTKEVFAVSNIGDLAIGDDLPERTLQRTVTTTDATQTTIASVTLTDQRAYRLEAVVIARKSDGTDRYYYRRGRMAYREGGGAALGAGSDEFTDDGASSADVAFTTSGNDVRLSVTGLAATTIKWTCVLRYQLVN